MGTGLAGASVAASMAEQGSGVEVFTFHDSPRRAHSVAAQGGVNAAKDYQNDGDRIWRMFQNTLKSGDFRPRGFPIKRDLRLDRSAFDRSIAAGGYVGGDTGQAPEANSIPVAHERAEAAFDAAACIGCGGCVAACPNASAALFTGAKVSQLALLPQGLPEANRRVKAMVQQMDLEAFGTCSHRGACTKVCPQGIGLEHIVRMNGEYRRALGFTCV